MIEEPTLVESLRQTLKLRVQQGKLELPTLPQVAVEVQRVVRSDTVPMGKIAKIVERDPVLALQVVRLANSAAFATRRKVESVQQAVTHLGLENLKKVLMAAASKQLFASRIPGVHAALERLWEHSLAVALLSQELAPMAGLKDVAGAYLAGLLHDIGKPIVAVYLLEVEQALLSKPGAVGIPDTEEWLRIVGQIHGPIGFMVAERWNMPDQVKYTIRDCGRDFEAPTAGSPGNVVRLANALAKMHGLYIGACDAAGVAGTVAKGRALLELDEARVSRLAEDVKGRLGD